MSKSQNVSCTCVPCCCCTPHIHVREGEKEDISIKVAADDGVFTSMEASWSRKPQRFPPLQPTGSRAEPKRGTPATEANKLPTNRGSREAWEEAWAEALRLQNRLREHIWNRAASCSAESRRRDFESTVSDSTRTKTVVLTVLLKFTPGEDAASMAAQVSVKVYSTPLRQWYLHTRPQMLALQLFADNNLEPDCVWR